eukprot:1756490-Pyramimonas_sp.AAC.1
MEGGFYKTWFSNQRRGHSSSNSAAVSRMEGGSLSTSHTCVLQLCNRVKGGGRFALRAGLSPQRRAHSELCNSFKYRALVAFKMGLSPKCPAHSLCNATLQM